MIVRVQVGNTVRETTIEDMLRHPGMERDPKGCITQQLAALFEAGLGDEWSKVQTQVNEICDVMGWGYTR